MPKKLEPDLVAVARYDRDDYPAVKAIEPVDNGMEDTYDEWLAFANSVFVGLAAKGAKIEWVDVRSNDLRAWLSTNGKENSPEARAAYVREVVSARFVTKN